MNDLFDLPNRPMESLLRGGRDPVNKDEQRFKEYHLAHPQAFVLFDRFTREAIRRGFKNYSAHGVLERIRWETNKPYDDHNPATGDILKISDHHHPYYARLWMEQNPQFDGFFRTKKLKGQPDD